MLRANRLKQRLLQGEVSTGFWLFMASPAATDVLSYMDTDALIVDLEHSSGSVETAVQQFRCGRERTMLARVSAAGAREILPLLDAGCEGIFAANVQSTREVERLVAACYYPPAGTRGLHYTVSRASGWGAHAADYADHAVRHTLVVAMIESSEGVEAIPEMAKVPGLDMLFIGPLDLSASIGLAGQYHAPAFLELLHEAERRCLEGGLALGGTVLPGHSVGDLTERGYRFITVGSDVSFLRQGCMQRPR
ncbi:MAG TPA: aldolase/citrate lyase family protein [Rhodanobacter sp.]